jgi:hypothetical protein
MGISKAWRLGGFIAALGASGALIAAATGATGAYFTDSHNGTIQAVSGHLKLNVTNTTLSFTGLMPGTDQTAQVSYHTDLSGGTEDVWLYFPDNQAYGQFTGAKGAEWSDGGLGRYGHFAVSDSNGGLAFQSYNLQNRPAGDTSTTDACPVDDNTGRGGSSVMATGVDDTPPYCGVPHYILLASNLGNAADGTITFTFGLTGRQTQQNQAEFLPAAVQYQIIGTQHGVRPDAPNF